MLFFYSGGIKNNRGAALRLIKSCCVNREGRINTSLRDSFYIFKARLEVFSSSPMKYEAVCFVENRAMLRKPKTFLLFKKEPKKE